MGNSLSTRSPNYRVFVLKLGNILTKNFKEISNE